MTNVRLKVPYIPQGKESANCGPCSIKMIADYYGVTRSSGDLYGVRSLNRLCKVSKEWGCEKSDINRVFRRLGLKRERVNFRNLSAKLKNKKPVISLLIDEQGEGHYAVITGVEGDKVIFNDSYWGENYSRKRKDLAKQIKPFNDWMWAVEPQ